MQTEPRPSQLWRFRLPTPGDHPAVEADLGLALFAAACLYGEPPPAPEPPAPCNPPPDADEPGSEAPDPVAGEVQRRQIRRRQRAQAAPPSRRPSRWAYVPLASFMEAAGNPLHACPDGSIET